MPKKLEETINKVLGGKDGCIWCRLSITINFLDFNIKALKDQANNLQVYLNDRRSPKEKSEIYEIKDKIRENLLLESI